MFKCPKCGIEISDNSNFCSNCGYQIPYSKKKDQQSFNGIKEEMETGIFGSKYVKCPICGSRYFDICNGIPAYRKILEIWIFGTVIPQTKNKYRDKMIYHCRKCDTVWNNKKIIKHGESNGYSPSPALPITIGIISILFSLILFLLAFTSTLMTKLFLIFISAVMISGGIVSIASIGKVKVSKAGYILYEISTIGLLLVFLMGGANFLPFLISGSFFLCMKRYEKKLS